MKQNIISFSLWGDKPKYLLGMEENCKLAPVIYPGWKVRIYIDNSIGLGFAKHLHDEYGAEVLLIPESRGSFDGMFWRMYVNDDPDVDRFIIRDADSRLNWREKAAVDEWIASGKPFHIMRDHVNHIWPIQGGMWGGIAGVINSIRYGIDRFGTYDKYACDQVFLKNCIGPIIGQKGFIVHDPIHAKIPFPPHESIAPGWFVGQIYDENGVPQKD